jgi:hypothetical protein
MNPVHLIAFAASIASLLAGCVASQPQVEFFPSRKSAVELRSMQARTVPIDADSAMRGVVATLHDLGYRITKVEPEGRTISATRNATLRLAVIVQARGPSESTVRANATILAPLREAQVDSPEFYRRNFFEPLGATLGRMPSLITAETPVPEAPQPAAELNTAREREAATTRARSAK